MKTALAILLLVSAAVAQDFDGTPWNISTGNLSVQFIQHSPIGAFPLSCSADELSDFIDKARPRVAGWIGFYCGKSPGALKASTNTADANMLQWLDVFSKQRAKNE